MDYCVCCGSPIPEGRLVCPACEADPEHISVRLKNEKSYAGNLTDDNPPEAVSRADIKVVE